MRNKYYKKFKHLIKEAVRKGIKDNDEIIALKKKYWDEKLKEAKHELSNRRK